MGKVIDFASFAGMFKSTKDFYTVNSELREYVERLGLTQTQQAELTEIIIKQIDALVELFISQLEQSANKFNGGAP